MDWDVVSETCFRLAYGEIDWHEVPEEIQKVIENMTEGEFNEAVKYAKTTLEETD